MTLDPLTLAIALVALVGASIQAVTGFGFGLVTMGLLPLLLPVEQAVPMVGAWGWTLNLLILWRLRAHLELRRVLPMVAGGVLGIPVGLAFLKGVDEAVVKGTLGLVLVGYGLLALGGGVKPRAQAISDRWGLLAGLLGGALGGAFNTSGPPVVIYVSLKGWDKDVATSALQAFFSFSSTFSLIGFWWAGLFTPTVVHTLLPLYPVVWLGSLVGARIYDRVPQERFRVAVLVLLVVLGASFLWSVGVAWRAMLRS